MKRCYSCNIEKPYSEYHKDKSRKDGFRETCKACRCKHPEQLYKRCLACNDPFITTGYGKAAKYCGAKCQRMHLRYGIDEYKFEDLLISQDYKCAICGNAETNKDKRTGKTFEMSVDHCHDTGQVRGLLCTACNTMIGMSKDSKEVLLSAVAYLEKYSGLIATDNSLQYRNKYRHRTG